MCLPAWTIHFLRVETRWSCTFALPEVLQCLTQKRLTVSWITPSLFQSASTYSLKNTKTNKKACGALPILKKCVYFFFGWRYRLKFVVKRLKKKYRHYYKLKLRLLAHLNTLLRILKKLWPGGYELLEGRLQTQSPDGFPPWNIGLTSACIRELPIRGPWRLTMNSQANYHWHRQKSSSRKITPRQPLLASSTDRDLT